MLPADMADPSQASADRYAFTADWFSRMEKTWLELVQQVKPSTVLEIGSFEGRSACWLIETLPPIVGGRVHVTCIDSWDLHEERFSDLEDAPPLALIESRFDSNVALAVRRAAQSVTVRKMKALSINGLAALLLEGKAGTFDMAYIDGGHSAPDVLADAVLAFRLLRVGGLLIFDDYLWANDPHHPNDVLWAPKPGIDAFMNVHAHSVRLIEGKPLYQLYALKTADNY